MIFHILSFCALVIFMSHICEAGGRTYVHGHFRSNGTYVAPHYRTSPDSSFYNNWSTIGNINPYTGDIGTRTAHSIGSKRSFRPSGIPGFIFAPVPPAVTKSALTYASVLPQFSIEENIPESVSAEIKNRATRQWPNNFSMQAYSIKKLRDGYIALQRHLRSFSGLGIPEEVRSWALQIAIRQWPDDYSMQAYLYEKNLEGYLRLSALISSEEYRNLPEIHAQWMTDIAYKSWSDDFSMQAYVLEKQMDGYYRLAKLFETLDNMPKNIAESITSKARASWPEDLSMQAYVVERELDGFKKLQELTR